LVIIKKKEHAIRKKIKKAASSLDFLIAGCGGRGDSGAEDFAVLEQAAVFFD